MIVRPLALVKSRHETTSGISINSPHLVSATFALKRTRCFSIHDMSNGVSDCFLGAQVPFLPCTGAIVFQGLVKGGKRSCRHFSKVAKCNRRCTPGHPELFLILQDSDQWFHGA